MSRYSRAPPNGKRFYQVRGVNPTIQKKDSPYQTDIELATDVFTAMREEALHRTGTSNTPCVVAVLGIRLDGTSCFLLNAAQAVLLTKIKGYVIGKNEREAREFASLSPIELDSVETLRDIFREYKIKAGKKTSRADQGAGVEERGRGLVLYEHSRTLIRYARQTLIDHQNFFLGVDGSFLQSMAIFSVATTPWSADSRTKDLRERQPKVIDVAWSLCHPVHEGQMAETIFHRRERLRNSATTDKYKEIPEHIPTSTPSQIATDFNKIFELATPALILLVFGPITKNWLGDIPGIDSHRWRDGIAEILSPQIQPTPEYRSKSQREMSPHRGRGSISSRSRDYKAHGSETVSVSGPKVYVVDVREMFACMINAMPPTSIKDMLGKLAETPEDYARSEQLSNSQDDCRMLFDAWRIMSEGPTYVQERLALMKPDRIQSERFAPRNEETAVQPSGPIDEDEDPDDGQPTVTAEAKAKEFIPRFDLEDDFGDDLDDD